MVFLLVVGYVVSCVLCYSLGIKFAKEESVKEEKSKIKLSLEEKSVIKESVQKVTKFDGRTGYRVNLKDGRSISVYRCSTTGIGFKYATDFDCEPEKVFTWEQVTELTDDFYCFYPQSLKEKLNKNKDTEDIERIILQSKKEIEEMVRIK